MGRQQQFAVEKHNVEDFVLKQYKDKIPASKISQLLLTEKKVKISPLSINRWLKKQRSADTSTKAVQSKEKFDVIVMDYNDEIKTILNEVKEIKAIAIAENKIDTYTKLVGKLYQGIELLAKLRGDLQQKGGGSVDINIIINEINKEAFDQNKTLRDNLHNIKVVDVEAEIIDDDKKEENKLRGDE